MIKQKNRFLLDSEKFMSKEMNKRISILTVYFATLEDGNGYFFRFNREKFEVIS